jgi:hypothetical protein
MYLLRKHRFQDVVVVDVPTALEKERLGFTPDTPCDRFQLNTV